MRKFNFASTLVLLTLLASGCQSSLSETTSETTSNPTSTTSTTSTVSTTSVVSTTSTPTSVPTSETTSEGEAVYGTELFISEYVEGPSNNKVLEIFNPKAETVDLSQYTVKLFSNGRAIDVTDYARHTMSGMLPSKGTFVFHYSLTTSAGVTKPLDDTSLINAINAVPSEFRWVGEYVAGAPTNIASFNGNDSIGLFKGETLIDVFGCIGLAGTANAANDPGTGWSVTFANGAGTTMDVVLTRIPTVHGPSVNALTYNIGSTPINFINSFNPLEWSRVVYTATPATHTIGTHTIS